MFPLYCFSKEKRTIKGKRDVTVVFEAGMKNDTFKVDTTTAENGILQPPKDDNKFKSRNIFLRC